MKRPLASRTAGKPSTVSGEADVGARAPVASLRMAMAPPVVYTNGCCNWASAELAKTNNTVKSRQIRSATELGGTHGDKPRAEGPDRHLCFLVANRRRVEGPPYEVFGITSTIYYQLVKMVLRSSADIHVVGVDSHKQQAYTDCVQDVLVICT